MRWLVYAIKALIPASLALAGCGLPVPDGSQNSSSYKIHAPLAQSTNIVFIMPIEGMKNPGRLVLADALAASLRDAARPSVISGQLNDQGPTIVGRISEVRRRGSIAWMTASWDLRAPYGTIVANVNHEIIVDGLLWDEGGVEAINLIVAEAEPHIIGMVADFVGPLAITEEVAMPPEERFSHPTGSSQVIEYPEVVASMPTLNADPKPVVTPAVPVAEISVRGVEPKQSNALTDADIKVSAPLVAHKQPQRLMPKGRGVELEDVEAVDNPDDQSMDDMALLRNAATAKPASMTETSDKPKLTPISWGRPSFLIRTVSGAPGDGNEVLTSGIKGAMRKLDLTITEDPRQAGYEVVGRVTVGPPVNGRQQARVVWVVNTLDGGEVGKAMQENAVIAGSLDGEWGRVGDIVSQAAAQGIEELFENKPNLGANPGSTPDFTRNPNLQQVPGRAPPPPNS